MRCTERLAAEGITPTIGSVGDSHDNALSEAVIGLYGTEVTRHRGPWRTFDAAERTTLEPLGLFNHRRRLEPIENIPPTGFAAFDEVESMRVAPYGSNKIAYNDLAAV